MKIGDRIRYTYDNGVDLTEGNIYTICRINFNGDFAVTDDVNEENWSVFSGRYVVVTEDTELDELRAFKAAALARFPELAEPETDEQAAERYKSALDDEGYGEGWNDILKDAFEWARANPR